MDGAEPRKWADAIVRRPLTMNAGRGAGGTFADPCGHAVARESHTRIVESWPSATPTDCNAVDR